MDNSIGTTFAGNKHPEAQNFYQKAVMNQFRILVVDDDPIVCEDISTELDRSIYKVDTAFNIESALSLFLAKRHHIVLADLTMDGQDDGFILLDKIKGIAPNTAVAIVTAHNDVKRAVKAMQLGAIDYITKPFENDQLLLKITRIADQINLQEEVSRLQRELDTQHELIGNSEPMQELRRQISIVARTESSVLITGPSGSGKELVARAIHRQSHRKENAFIAVNAAAITETLIESELFGTVKGAFTGALDKKGKFELAHEGTLFLDEIGDMSLSTQAKILRAIDQNVVSPVGSVKNVSINVRIITATNKDLSILIEKELFREDLYYRLNVIPLETKPLRERREDIPLLIEHFLLRNGKTENLGRYFSPEAIDCLCSHEWPGNVRELNNMVQRLIIFSNGVPVKPEQINFAPVAVSGRKGTPFMVDASRFFRDACAEFEKQFIARVLDNVNWNVTDAAKQLDLQRAYLYEKMKKLGIERNTK